MIDQWMENRHSVRQYDGKALDAKTTQELKRFIQNINQQSGQDFQLKTDEPEAFGSGIVKYGQFKGVVNYIGLVGDNEEKLGYYGEMIVEQCTKMGLKTCWVGLTFNKKKARLVIPAGCKLYGVIVLGTSSVTGVAHKARPLEQFAPDLKEAPAWFQEGIKGIQLAPSALNQQKYRFSYQNNQVQATKGTGFYTAMDLGIAKYHFNQASGHHAFSL